MVDILFFIGRVLVGGYFITSGVMGHFKNHGMLAGYAASKGVPMSGIAVYLTGFLLIAGGAGILTGAYISLAVACLALFFIPVTFWMHRFWEVADPQMKMMEMVNFMKNIALLGFSLMLLIIRQPWPFALF